MFFDVVKTICSCGRFECGPFVTIPFYLQALSISKSLLTAKSAAEKGQVVCQELKDAVVRVITKAGGKIDYAEVNFDRI